MFKLFFTLFFHSEKIIYEQRVKDDIDLFVERELYYLNKLTKEKLRKKQMNKRNVSDLDQDTLRDAINLAKQCMK